MPDLLTGLVITLGMVLSTAPLAFVAIAAVKRQGILAEHWRLLGKIVVAALMARAPLGYLVLRNQPLELRMVLAAPASGFLTRPWCRGSFRKPTAKVSQASRECFTSVSRRSMS